jgi:hypothetical protein
MRAVLVLVVLLIASPALADAPLGAPRVYVGATAEAGFDVGLRSGLGVEAAVRPAPKVGFWLRARGVTGEFAYDAAPGGRYWIAGLGAEGQHCSATGGACFVAGADLAAIRMRADAYADPDPIPAQHFRGYALLPRLGGDVGGRNVRVRAIAQATIGDVEEHNGVGLSLSTSLLVRF